MIIYAANMLGNALINWSSDRYATSKFQPILWVGILIGIIMPVISAIIYPTYVHKMPDPFLEWTRLQELPFVFCEALIIGWAVFRGMELRQFIEKIPSDCRVAIICLFAGLWYSTLLVSKVPITSMTISLSYVLHLLFGCSIFYLLQQRDEIATDQLFMGLAAGLLVMATITAWRFLWPPVSTQLNGGAIEWQAALPGYISLRHFGSWAGAITAMFTAILMRRKNMSTVTWHDGVFLLAMAMTIWSGTRAAMLAIAVTGLILVLADRRLPSIRVIGRLCILTGMAASLAYLLIPYGDTNFMLFTLGDDYSSVSKSGSGRVGMWQATYASWLEAPIFGWGSGSTFWELDIGWTHTQPHNFVLQFLISWGIIGAGGAIWLLGRSVVEAHRRVKLSPDAWPLLAGLYSLLTMACVEGMLHYPRFIMLIMVLFAVLFRVTERTKNRV